MSNQIKPAFQAITRNDNPDAQASLWLYSGIQKDGTITGAPYLEISAFHSGTFRVDCGFSLGPGDAQALRDLADTLDAVFAAHKEAGNVASA